MTPHPVVIWKKINNRMSRLSGSHIKTIVVSKFFIKIQEEGIRM